jgi:hypothetical protein
MRNLRTALVATAMALGLGLAAAPASAHFMGGGGGHFGGGHFGRAHGGGFGYGVVDVGGYDDGCIRWRPTYDNAGNYMGREPVSVCD